MKIYIASSFKNLHAVRMLRDVLTNEGHTVPDWTELAPPIPSTVLPEERKRMLDTDNGGELFTFCSEACAESDLVIYLGKAGQDAGVEVGMAFVAGLPIIGLRGAEESVGLMLHGCVTRWAESVEELLKALPEYENFTFDAEVLHG